MRIAGKKERKGSKEETCKKPMVALLVFVIATLQFLAEKKNRWTQKVHLAVTFSDIFSYFSTVLQEVLNCVKWFIAM